MLAVLVVAATLACAGAYPVPRAYYPAYPYYNMDAVSMGGSGGEGATVLSRYYQPYQYQQQPYWSGAAFMYGAGAGENRRAERLSPQLQQRHPARSPEQNELAPPPAELEEVTESAPRVTELLATEPQEEETTPPAPAAPAKPGRRLHGDKRVLKPSYQDEVDDEEIYPPSPAAAYFPMYFGYGGGRRGGGEGGGGGGGVTAIANAYSTGRGGVATSHATAYGARPGSHH